MAFNYLRFKLHCIILRGPSEAFSLQGSWRDVSFEHHMDAVYQWTECQGPAVVPSHFLPADWPLGCSTWQSEMRKFTPSKAVLFLMVDYEGSDPSLDIGDEQNHHVLPRIILWLLLVVASSCPHTLPKDILDLQGLKSSCLALALPGSLLLCVATDVLQLLQAPPEEPSQEKFLPGVLPVKGGIWTIPDIQQGSSTPNSSYISFLLLQLLHAKFLQSNFCNSLKIWTNAVTMPSSLL